MSALLLNVDGSTRDRIIDAAITLFAEHGFQAISMRDLAKHVGINAGSLYNHIETKQELLYEIIESTLSSLIAVTRRSINKQVDPAKKTQAFLQSFSSFRRSDEVGLVLVFREIVSLDINRKVDIGELQRTYFLLLEDILSPMYCDKNHLSDISEVIVGFLFGQLQWPSMIQNDRALMAHLTRFVITSNQGV